MKKSKSFTCGHCGHLVKGGKARNGRMYSRNECPECLWSKHVEFGVTSQPPCGAMMRGIRYDDDHITFRCTGCGFTYWATADEYGNELGSKATGRCWWSDGDDVAELRIYGPGLSVSQRGVASVGDGTVIVRFYKQFPSDRQIMLDEDDP